MLSLEECWERDILGLIEGLGNRVLDSSCNTSFEGAKIVSSAKHITISSPFARDEFRDGERSCVSAGPFWTGDHPATPKCSARLHPTSV